MGKNHASGNDRVAAQVGKVVPRGKDQPKAVPPKPVAAGTSTNVVKGNAQVGEQTDVVVGNLNIRM